MAILQYIKSFLGVYSPEDRKLVRAVKQISGSKPSNLTLYKLALIHSSTAKENKDGFRESNERLEYLGDAILGAVVAEYLFKAFPYKEEGFLTEIRSRIVSRDSLNLLARKIGLDKLINYDSKRRSALSFKYVYGDAIEAFIGAIYLDKGFHFCKKFIIKKLLITHVDLAQVVSNEVNFKSKLIEWAQKQNKNVRFEAAEEKGNNHQKQFRIQLLLDSEIVAYGSGYSKKSAEQDAARRACEALLIP